MLDPEYEVEIQAATLRSRSKNSPFLGWRLRGAAVMTIVSGNIIFERCEEETGMRAILALADGTYFEGESFGAPGEALGEVVFNTSMMGYQEILDGPVL